MARVSESVEASGDTTRERLIDVARELFARDGYRETSVRRITDAAGANLGSITYHFGSKAALYGVVLAETLRPLRDAMLAMAQSGGSVMDRIERFVEGQYRFMSERPQVKALMLRHLASEDEVPEPLYHVIKGHIENLKGLIREGQQSGEIRDGDPAQLAVCVASGPIWFNAVRGPMRQVIDLEQDTEESRASVSTTLRTWVRAGLEKRR